MPSLREQLAASTAKLKGIGPGIRSRQSEIPNASFEKWTGHSLYYQVLDRTDAIFDARDVAWQQLDQLKSAQSSNAPNNVEYGGNHVDFEIARHLCLVSYMACCWAIYDRISNVCGRITSTKEIALNPKQNPKCCEDFLNDSKKSVFGFITPMHATEYYNWPLKVSYKIRNWLVHEGLNENDIEMFSGSAISDSFQLHSDAIDHLQTCCDYGQHADGQIKNCQVDKSIDPWNSNDLLQILEIYNLENDRFFAGLVRWAVESQALQVKYFVDPF